MTAGTDRPTLKPCPFCAEQPLTIYDDVIKTWFVQCDCSAQGPAGRTELEAITAWNRRTAIVGVRTNERFVSRWEDCTTKIGDVATINRSDGHDGAFVVTGVSPRGEATASSREEVLEKALELAGNLIALLPRQGQHWQRIVQFEAARDAALSYPGTQETGNG